MHIKPILFGRRLGYERVGEIGEKKDCKFPEWIFLGRAKNNEEGWTESSPPKKTPENDAVRSFI
jgi:hypothetical protein